MTMPSTSNAAVDAVQAFELKGRMLTLSVLRLLTVEPALLAKQLDARIAAMPELFERLPLVLDLEALQGQALDLAALLDCLRQKGLTPIAVRAGQADAAAQAAGLATIQLDPGPTRRVEHNSRPPAQPGLVIRQPVRSGQQVYAQDRDLIVLAPVSAGAELLADGHIHVYGPLRGRALAGVQGNTEAGIFCQNLEAELVSIAGIYCTSENMDDAERGRAVHIHLDGEALRFALL